MAASEGRAHTPSSALVMVEEDVAQYKVAPKGLSQKVIIAGDMVNRRLLNRPY